MTTVLIVDDHGSFRASARALLEAEGYQVVGEAADGLSAVEAVERLQPDVVLLDVQLPDIDGFEVAARVAGAASPPKVVLTSSREACDYGELVDDAPVRGFVAKDRLTPEALSDLLAG